MRLFCKLALLVFALISSGRAQDIAIATDDPCATDLGVPSPSDNLSCEFVTPGGTFCYPRNELCNGVSACFTGSDEGANIAALDCKFVIRNFLILQKFHELFFHKVEDYDLEQVLMCSCVLQEKMLI